MAWERSGISAAIFINVSNFRVARLAENTYSSRPPRRGCIRNGDERNRRDPPDLRTFRRTSANGEQYRSVAGTRGYPGTGQLFPKDLNSILLATRCEYCTLCRSMDISARKEVYDEVRSIPSRIPVEFSCLITSRYPEDGDEIANNVFVRGVPRAFQSRR